MLRIGVWCFLFEAVSFHSCSCRWHELLEWLGILGKLFYYHSRAILEFFITSCWCWMSYLYILSRPTLSGDLVMYRDSWGYGICVRDCLEVQLRLEPSFAFWEDHLLKLSTCPHVTELRSPLRGGKRQYVALINIIPVL